MVQLLGTSWPVFVGMTVLLFGFASFMTGQAVANIWQPIWQVALYAILLGCADRFLIWGLFDGELLLLSGYIIDVLTLMAIGALAYRLTLARKMVRQYPWLYEPAGPFGWRRKA